MRFAQFGEKDDNPTSHTFVYYSQRVYERLLSVPRIRNMLMDADTGTIGDGFNLTLPDLINGGVGQRICR